MGQAHRDAERWADAKAATARVPAWLAARWMFAQEYNAHRPQGPIQERTRAAAKQVAAQAISALGGDLMAPPPPGLGQDSAWSEFLAAVTPLGDRRLGLVSWLLEDRLAQGAERVAWMDRIHRLRLLVKDMRKQQRANRSGWKPGKGPPRKRSPRRRR
jgi:hypothetical protein